VLPIICFIDMADKFDETDENNNQITISTTGSQVSVST